MPRFAGYMLICSFRSPPTAPVWEVPTRRFQRRVGAPESYDQIESAVKGRAVLIRGMSLKSLGATGARRKAETGP
jgi:hypothetical protein